MLKVHHVDVVGSEDRVKRDGRTDAADCTTFPANAFGNYFAPNREEKCCDERICVCVCVFVCPRSYLRNYTSDLQQIFCACVGFVAAAVSMPMGGCRAIRPVVVDVVSVTVELAVL